MREFVQAQQQRDPSAVAENATTMPVITSACGTVAAESGGRAAPCHDPNSRNTPAADEVEGDDLAQQPRSVSRP